MFLRLQKKNIFLWGAVILCAVIFLIAQCAVTKNLARVRALYSAVGLRYERALSENQIDTALAFVTGARNTNGLTAAFWREDRASVTAPVTERSVGAVTAIGICGNAHDCFGLDMLFGSMPPLGGEGECAVSAPLAHALWGSEDVVGLTLKISRTDSAGMETIELTVCGVADAPREVLFYGAAKDAGFTRAELFGVSWDNPFDSCEQALAQTGLGTPEQIVYGEQLAALYALCALVPWACVGAMLFSALKRWLARADGREDAHISEKFPRRFALFAAACALLILLCLAVYENIGDFPAWLIPARWADAAAWQTIFRLIKEQYLSRLAFVPTEKDILFSLFVDRTLVAIAVQTAAVWGLGHTLCPRRDTAIRSSALSGAAL